MSTATSLIEAARKQGRTVLTEVESKGLLATLGISTTDTKMAVSREEAVALSGEMGFPVVIKVVSPDISHKSDAGGVKVSLKDKEQVAQAYDGIMSSCREKFPDASLDGVSVQNMARPGIEVIIGMTKDPQFGPVMMFGLGGVWVEVLKDVSFRIVPLTRSDAAKMIQQIKGYPLLQGFRGSEPANTPVLEDILLRLSSFVADNPDIKEMDLNPVFAYKDGAVAVDARIILEEE